MPDWWAVLHCAAVEMVRNGTVAGYMTQVTLLQYLVNQQPCDMAIVESGWGYGEQVSCFLANLCKLFEYQSCALQPLF